MSFKIRTSKPTFADKYIKFYNTPASKGKSACIKGKPTDAAADVLANCVGYACGRFNEIYAELTGTTEMKYPYLNNNAEDWIERAKSLGLSVGQTPKPGAVMCWAKGKIGNGSDGAGHVAIVEKVNDDGSVYTSESGYNNSAFWNSTRSNANGRWGIGSAYTFRGFIYNPAVKDEAPKNEPVKETATTVTLKEGDIVEYTGTVHYYSANSTNPIACTPGKAVLKQIYHPESSRHPYLCVRTSDSKGTVWGWVDAKYIKPVNSTAPVVDSKPTTPVTTKELKATKPAKSGPTKALAGTYVVTADAGLNIRDGAGTNEKILGTLPKGTKVTCYGYYTVVNKVKWFSVIAECNGIKYTGFVSSEYLKKQ